MKQTRQHKEQNAEKLIRELFAKDNLKKITPEAANKLMHFYNTKSFNRLQTARAIYKLSQEPALKPQRAERAVKTAEEFIGTISQLFSD